MRYKWGPSELHVKKDRNAITVEVVEMDRSLVFEGPDVYCFKRGFLTDGVSAPAFAKVFIPDIKNRIDSIWDTFWTGNITIQEQMISPLNRLIAPTHSPKFSGVIVSTSASGYRFVTALVTRLFFFGFHLNSNALIFEPQTSR